MELIVLTQQQGVKRPLHLGGFALAGLAVAAVGLLAGAFGLGAVLGPFAVDPEPGPEQVAASMRQELADDRRQVAQALGEARLDLDALALRLSDLQARTIRIDALGSRLVTLAGLDAGEFSFGTTPARGGAAPVGPTEPNSVPDFVADLERLEAQLDLRVLELEALEASLLSERVTRVLRPSGRPLDGGWISSSFGRRNDPLTGQRAMHNGVDFAGRRGSPVRAVASGIVTFSGVKPMLGRLVEIDHGNGYATRYGHNLENLVEVGQRVVKGEHIALLGSTGRSTGYHVHFEVLRNGRRVNPMTYIRAGDKAPTS
jgi:murein DD-endopeptidase MepM/ murein hydrolase activator NlpD